MMEQSSLELSIKFSVKTQHCLLVDSVVNNHVRSTEPVKLPFLFLELGMEETQKWIDTGIVGCLQSFFIECQKGDWLKDPQVLFFEYTDRCDECARVVHVVLFLSRLDTYGKFSWDSTAPMQWINL